MSARPVSVVRMGNAVQLGQWRWEWPGPGDDGVARGLGSELRVPAAFARVVAGRGIRDAAAAAALRRPSLQVQYAGGRGVVNAGVAARLLVDAAADGPVGLLCDYDVDGAAAAAVLGGALEAVGAQVVVEVPKRGFEGFGPNRRCLDALVEAGVRVVALLDCGSVDFELMADCYRREGVRAVVIDHHPVRSGVTAFGSAGGVLVNPAVAGGAGAELTAAGLAWVVGLKVLRYGGLDGTQSAAVRRRMTALAGLATVADMVRVDDLLNRALVQGAVGLLRVDRGAGGVGLEALMDVAGVGSDGELTAEDFGWRIGPRLNAGSRMGESALAAGCLLEVDAARGREAARRLDAMNVERRELCDRLKEAVAAECERDAGRQGRVMVRAVADGTPGIAGLLAADLVRRWGWPAVVLVPDPAAPGVWTGSGRSGCGFDLGAAVAEAVRAGVAEAGGGHAAACGVTVKARNVAALARGLDRAFGEEVPHRVPTVRPDAVLRGSEIDGLAGLGEVEAEWAPWGVGFERPCYGVRDVRVEDSSRSRKGNVVFLDCEADGKAFGVVWWDPPADWRERCRGRLEIAGQVDVYRGRGRLAVRGDVRSPESLADGGGAVRLAG